MPITNAQELFLHELSEIYDAEERTGPFGTPSRSIAQREGRPR